MYKNYNMDQLTFPLEIGLSIPSNHIARLIHEQVESIPETSLQDFFQLEGRPSYNPKMMLKIILFAYSRKVTSGRKIEVMLMESLPMMWLAAGETPSYRTINRARISPCFDKLLKDMYVSMHLYLYKEKHIKGDRIFIDGTKIEADANKYTFVWKKSTKKYADLLQQKISDLYDALKEDARVHIDKEKDQLFSVDDLIGMEEAVSEIIEELDVAIEKVEKEDKKELRQKRTEYKKQKKALSGDYKERLLKYDSYKEILGERNSFSKTDHDATFMRMKDDHMRNGQLKPGYNIQIATDSQFVLHAQIFQNPTDFRTFVPFINSFESALGNLPEYLCADAGYGSEPNYREIVEEKTSTALIPYTMHRKEQSRKYKHNIFNTANWEYRELDDYYVCPNNQALTFEKYMSRTDKYGYKRDLKVYVCEDCSGCSFKEKCTKAKGNRTLQYNPTWEELKNKAKQSLESEKGQEIYAERKIDVEPVFGQVKANLGFTRFHLRGLEKVLTETNIIFMVSNLIKLALKCQLNQQNQRKVGGKSLKMISHRLFYWFKNVLSQPLSISTIFVSPNSNNTYIRNAPLSMIVISIADTNRRRLPQK